MSEVLRFSPIFMLGNAQVALGSLVKIKFKKKDDEEEREYQGRIVSIDRNKNIIQLDCSEKYNARYHFILLHTITAIEVINL